MTAYFHFMFTTLDLSVIRDAPNANVTAIQVFEPDNKLANNLLAEYNFKNMINHKDYSDIDNLVDLKRFK